MSATWGAWVAVLASFVLGSCRCTPSGDGLAPTAPAPATKAPSGAGSSRADAGAAASAEAVTDASDAGDAAGDAGAKLPPLREEPFVTLKVEGFGDAVVSIPSGATEPRPVVTALHGNFDRPEWQCEVWRGITGAYPFILCPRGIPRGDAPKSWDRWTYGAMQQVKAELHAGLDALEKRFGDYADDGPVVFTGFSLGAILGRYIVKEDPERFPRVVFTEGGNKGWDWLARAFKKGGGQRVLFACGQVACMATSKAAARYAKAIELPARVANGGKPGHTYDGPVAAAITRHWGWLLAGDDRFPEGRTFEEESSDAGLTGDADLD